MKKVLSLLVACAAFSSTSFSQSLSENGCGTTADEAQLQRIEKFVAEGMPSVRSKGTAGMDSIPLTIHIVGKTNGTGYYELDKLFPLICNVNNHFAPVNFYFYIAWPIKYINNDSYYEHDFNSGYQMMATNNVSNTVNVYFVQDPSGNCGYYSPSQDAVAIGKNCAAVNSTTLTHELGHFFDLPHTFSGWENGNTPTNPERVARTGSNANCSSRGDRFCDTDADYVGYRWSCPYTGPVLTDPLGVQLVLDSSLYMSYATDACMTRFSGQQMAFMQNDLSKRPNLLQFSAPPHSSLSAPNVAYPNNLMYSNDRTIRWNKVPGAQYYLVKFATQTLPTLPRAQWFTSDTSVAVALGGTNGVLNGVNYFATITPINGKNLCSGQPTQHSFTYTDALSINNIASDANIELVPNPSSNATELRVDNTFKGRYSFQMMNMAGQVVKQHEVNFNTSNNVLPIATQDLPNGIYTLKISGDKGMVVKKLVVQH